MCCGLHHDDMEKRGHAHLHSWKSILLAGLLLVHIAMLYRFLP